MSKSRGKNVFHFHLSVWINLSLFRFQAVQLLRKFHKYDIITRVDGKETLQSEFQDNNDLYRLSQAALDQLPVVKPNEEENNIPTVHSMHTQHSMGLQSCSLANDSVISDCNSLATVKTMRTVRRTFSNASSLRPYELPQLNCCINSAFNNSLSDEKTPRKPFMQRSVFPQVNKPTVNKGLYEASAAARIQHPVNVFWLWSSAPSSQAPARIRVS